MVQVALKEELPMCQSAFYEVWHVGMKYRLFSSRRDRIFLDLRIFDELVMAAFGYSFSLN
jgi:hypothetical protein